MDIYKQQKFLFVYLCGVLNPNTGEIEIKHVDSLKYAFREFEDEIYNNKSELMNFIDDKVIELFCIVGDKSSVWKANMIFKKAIKNFSREQLLNKDTCNMDTNLKSKDSTLNKLLALYLDHLNNKGNTRFPKQIDIQSSDMVSLCFYSNNDVNSNRQDFANSVYQIWFKNAKPNLFGKQVITQSFMLDDLKGRRIICSQLDNESGETYLLLEGGLALYLRDHFAYFREKVGQANLNFFSFGDIETILTNPIYAFNKWFVPHELFEDWQKVLNYVLAISNIQWTIDEICIIHKRFMIFMENDICEVEHVQGNKTIISKDQFYECYKIQIDSIRKYFTGYEEAVLSKDYLLLLRSRFVFLPTILNLIEQTFPYYILFNNKKEFCLKEYNELLTQIDTGSVNDKGKILEDIAEYLIERTGFLQVMGKRIHSLRDEIDLCCCNISLDSELWKMGPFMLVECKNWKDKVGVEIIRQLSYIMFYKGNTATILFASNGITKQAAAEIEKHAVLGKYIICFNKEDLKLFKSGNDFIIMLKSKYRALESIIANNLDILGM